MLLAEDVATVKVRDAIREEVWSVLSAAGLVAGPPPPAPKPRNGHLRLVTPQGGD